MKKPSHNRRRRSGRPTAPAGGPPSDAGQDPGSRADASRSDEVDIAIVGEELGDNQLAESVLRFVDRMRPHFGTILAALGVVAAGIVTWGLVTSQAEATRQQSWDAMLAALSSGEADALGDVGRRFPGTAAARWAELLLADRAAAEGAELLFVDRGPAEARLRSAVDLYTAVMAANPQGRLAERAAFGLARARESLGQLGDARRGYDALAAEHPDDPLARIARARAVELGRDATRQWYDWFAAQKPTPPGKPADDGPAFPAPDAPAPPAESAATP